jgi:hypothetical protein
MFHPSPIQSLHRTMTQACTGEDERPLRAAVVLSWLWPHTARGLWTQNIAVGTMGYEWKYYIIGIMRIRHDKVLFLLQQDTIHRSISLAKWSHSPLVLSPSSSHRTRLAPWQRSCQRKLPSDAFKCPKIVGTRHLDLDPPNFRNTNSTSQWSAVSPLLHWWRSRPVHCEEIPNHGSYCNTV